MVTHRYGHRRPLRGLAPVTCSAALALTLLAGCSSSGDEGVTTARPDTTASYAGPGSSPASPGASASPSTSASALPTGASATISGAQLADSVRAAAARDRTVRTTVAVTGPLAIKGTGAADVSSSPAALRLAVSLAGEKAISVVRTKGDVYLKLPGQLVPGKDWVAVPQSTSDPVASMYATTFEGYETPSDLAVTPKVLAGLGTYTVAGSETVDGAAATKYTASTSAGKAAKLMPPAYQSVNPTRMKAGTAKVSVWVDGSGRLLRTATDAKIPSTQRIKVLIGYTGWGQAVDVKAPASSEVGRVS